MKLLSKMNRGLIAALIVLIAVVIYIIAVTVSQNNQKPELKNDCEKYIAMDIKLRLLPGEYLNSNNKVPQSLQNSIISDMKNDIKAAYISNMPLVNTVIKLYQDNLDSQFKNGSNLSSEKRQILKFDSFDFEGNSVVVNFTSLVNEKDITGYVTKINGAASPTYQSAQGQTNDSISFEKVNGEWKVVAANLSEPSSGSQSAPEINGINVQVTQTQN